MDPITLGLALLLADFIVGGPASGAIGGGVRGAVREVRTDFGKRRAAIRKKRRKELMKTRGGRALLWLEDAARAAGRGIFVGGGQGAREGWKTTGDRMKRRASKVTKPVAGWWQSGEWDTSDVPDDGDAQEERRDRKSESDAAEEDQDLATPPARIVHQPAEQGEELLAQLRRQDWQALARAEAGICIYLPDQGGECGRPTEPDHIYCPPHVRQHVRHEGEAHDVTLDGYRTELADQAEAATRREGRTDDSTKSANDFLPDTHISRVTRDGIDGPAVQVEALHKRADGTWVARETAGQERVVTSAEVDAALARWRSPEPHEPPNAAGVGRTTNQKENRMSTDTGEATNAPQVLAAWDTLAKAMEQVKEQVEADDAAGFGLPGDPEAIDAADVVIAAAKAKHDEFDAMVEAAEGKQHTHAGAYQD